MTAETQRLDVRAYAEVAMARLVSAGRGAATVDWRKVVERGLSAAYQQEDAEALAAMVQVIAHLLDGQGRFEDAVAEIDHALVFAAEAPDARLALLGLKAAMLSAPGNIREARAALATGQSLLGQVQFGGTVRFRIFRAIVLWQFFENDENETRELLRLTAQGDFRQDRPFLLSWYVPFLAATASRREAHPWIRALRLDAEAAGSRWRMSDASAFEAWDDSLREPSARGGHGALDTANALSLWRAKAVNLRGAILQRDDRAADGALDGLRQARRRIGSAGVGSVEQFAQAKASLEAFGDALDLNGPPTINLNNLGACLAEAEAVATQGTQRAAGEWLDRLGALVPETVLSSLEWPVSVHRICGLLAARAGVTRRARTELQSAVDWSIASGNVPETALSLLQLGELCASADLHVAERTWKAHRKEGAARLRALGYDPTPPAYAVAHSLTLSTRNRLAERLSPREVDVLAKLSAGMSYREAAEALGIATATVQTLAHRAYEKLGVSGRVRAVAEAHRLGVL